MRREIGWAALLLVPGLILFSAGPAGAQAKKKEDEKKNEKKDDEKKKDEKKTKDEKKKDDEEMKGEKAEGLVKIGALVGKVASIYDTDRKISVTVSVPTLQYGGNGRPTVQNVNKDVELRVRDDVLVRTARPKDVFDEKGRIKRLTRAELKELKGDPKLPGYKAEYGDLATGQVIEVTLVGKKAAAVKPKLTRRKKDKEDIDGPDTLGDNLPQVSRIIILAEPLPGR